MQMSYGQHVFVLVYPVAKRAESAARKKTSGKERGKKLCKFDGARGDFQNTRTQATAKYTIVVHKHASHQEG